MAKSEVEATQHSDSSDSSDDLGVERPPVRSGHAARYQAVYNFFGFKKAYNFPLWVIFAGAMLGFSLSRLQDLNYDKNFPLNINPGFWYYFHAGSYRVGMIMHLAGVLPAGILMVFQFTPIMRYKWITLHRINGYLCILLLFIGNIGACMALHHNDNGTRIAAQTIEAFLVIITTIGMAMAWWNIRRLQIDQHRAWMLRSMFYFGTIISSRVMDNIASVIVTRLGDYYTVWSCDEIDFLYKQFGVEGILEAKYPQCLIPNGTLDGKVVVNAARILTEPERAGTSGAIPFGAVLWIATIVHLIGVEIYLGMTPREAERLRQVSYERQLKAGFKHPGSAGLTSDRWGDAEPWKPKTAEHAAV